MAYFFRKEHCEHNDRYLCFSCAVKKGAELVANTSLEKTVLSKNNCENTMDVTGIRNEEICSCGPDEGLCDSVHDVSNFFDFCTASLQRMPKNGDKKTLEFEHRNDRRSEDITIRLQMKRNTIPFTLCEFYSFANKIK
jgi:hypothetical protein